MSDRSLDPHDPGIVGDPGDQNRERPLTTIFILSIGSALLFGIGLLISESVGEVAVDVDLKPFFIPYLLITVVRFGIPTLSVGVGAAVGEGILDVFEGYELDDPLGFIGYVVGFLAFGWYLAEVADDPTAPRSLVAAAILGGFVQAVFESFAFLIFEPSAGVGDTVISLVGNTVTHGIVLGAIPLIVLFPYVNEFREAVLQE